VFLFPSGSLVTPISERVSPSLWLLARRCNAAIVPLTFVYRGFLPVERQLLYRPLRLILSRIGAPEATILCREGKAIDPSHFDGGAALCNHIRELYGSLVSDESMAA
jgi:capsular polysaccharide export protein